MQQYNLSFRCALSNFFSFYLLFLFILVCILSSFFSRLLFILVCVFSSYVHHHHVNICLCKYNSSIKHFQMPRKQTFVQNGYLSLIILIEYVLAGLRKVKHQIHSGVLCVIQMISVVLMEDGM